MMVRISYFNQEKLKAVFFFMFYGGFNHAPHSLFVEGKETEIEYRTVTINTEQKVSDVYNIEERLGS